MPILKKIVVIGPESTGKSTLCRDLAAHYHTEWVPEFAREYLLAHGMSYTYDDLLTIARGQLAQEDEYIAKVSGESSSPRLRRPGLSAVSEEKDIRYLFVDTDMYVMKVWCEFVFGKCHPWILDQIQTRPYDGYLLCRTDLPWVKDELREYPDPVTREKLFQIYRDCMIHQLTPWAEISGAADQRLLSAVRILNKGIF